MTRNRRWRRSAARTTTAAIVLAASALALTGCGLKPATAFVPAAGPGTIAQSEAAKGQPITVVGKNFTEALVLEKIAVLTLQAMGFDVTDLANVPGSQPVRNLMLSGQGDVSWEYTGTGWLVYLGKEKAIPDPDAQWEAVRDADLENGITWLPRTEVNNTYAMAVRSEALPELQNITKLSELAALPVEQRTFCIESEFNSRRDGMDGLLEAYGIPRGTPDGVPDENIGIFDTGAVYQATAKGTCNFGEVFTTDGRIEALDLTVLEDDKNYFPSYNASVTVRTETLERYPSIAEAFAQVSAALSDDVMRELNGNVDVRGEEPAEVAFEWMVAEGFISRP